MRGQMIFPSCGSLGFAVRCLIRDTSRRDADTDLAARDAMDVTLHVFRDGVRVGSARELKGAGPEGILEISDQNCPELAEPVEHLVVVECSRGEGSDYFAQEHQLLFEHVATGGSTTLLYEQLPIPAPGASSRPIVLLAPKAWVSSTLDTYVVFSSSASLDSPEFQERPMEISVLNEAGDVVACETRLLRANDVAIFDVRSAVSAHVAINDTPTFFNVVARGGSGAFAIFAIILDDRTGATAVEHSLSPHYYVTSYDRLRTEALVGISGNAP